MMQPATWAGLLAAIGASAPRPLPMMLAGVVMLVATLPMGLQCRGAMAQGWAPAAPNAETGPPGGLPLKEGVEADVSTRRVRITSSFTGVEIIVFGAINNARPDVAEANAYDVAVVVEGARERLTARRKTNKAGIWLNTQSIVFESVPSYYAIASTKPLDEIANALVLRQNDIGFERIPMQPVAGWETGATAGGLQDFRNAVIRLKGRERLYIDEPYGVEFVGLNLFRTTIDLPANVPVGPLDARVHLFRDGQLVDTFRTRVQLERQGIERYLHMFAFDFPLLYGIFTVLVAAMAGLLASAVVRRIRG